MSIVQCQLDACPQDDRWGPKPRSEPPPRVSGHQRETLQLEMNKSAPPSDTTARRALRVCVRFLALIRFFTDAKVVSIEEQHLVRAAASSGTQKENPLVTLAPGRGDLREAGQTPVYDEPGACRSSGCFQNSCRLNVIGVILYRLHQHATDSTSVPASKLHRLLKPLLVHRLLDLLSLRKTHIVCSFRFYTSSMWYPSASASYHLYTLHQRQPHRLVAAQRDHTGGRVGCGLQEGENSLHTHATGLGGRGGQEDTALASQRSHRQQGRS